VTSPGFSYSVRMRAQWLQYQKIMNDDPSVFRIKIRTIKMKRFSDSLLYQHGIDCGHFGIFVQQSDFVFSRITP
jgi:hypothetical protein